MYRIKTLNAISNVIREVLDGRYEIDGGGDQPQAILVRSASMHEMDLPDSLLSVARAGAGVNNIPVERCTEKGVCVFNTPGANANAVSELVVAGLLLASRDVLAGAQWVLSLRGEGEQVEKQVEKGKGRFAGPEIRGKTLGVIGLGAIGAKVANAADALGMRVLGYDPLISVEHAWTLSRTVARAGSVEQIFQQCDYISLHVPLVDATRRLVDGRLLAMARPGVRLLNFARAGLVDTPALLAALAEGRVARYVTDFPTDELLGVENVLCIPHLGASTPESEENCARMAAEQTRDYLECGAIRNSVNLPDVALAPLSKPRLCVIHRNVPNALGAITSAVASYGINISDLINRSRGGTAVSVLDLDEVPDGAVDTLPRRIAELNGTIRVRLLGV
jgi:D-3-phosphoglycerate dehydrogenase